MSEQTKPVISIGIIFKDNIRSIERCLKALQPLRDAIPCELVMADTGAKDGSREVAEKYADVLFDFPWINDFAAARNAVIDRSSGEWYLSVDTDEYLDEDVSELLNFLRTADESVNMARVNIRNYRSYEMDGAYSDFYTLRLIRVSTGARYKGAIHEAWTGLSKLGPIARLSRTIFHHDGYVEMSKNTEKLERNMTLLRQKLKDDPQNLLVRLQIVESGIMEEDYLKQVRRAVALLARKPDGWRQFGPPILRYAVSFARDKKLPELQDWTDRALKWFPDSYFTRIDVNSHSMAEAYKAKDYAACIPLGEALMEAYDDYRAGRGDIDCQVYSTLQMASPVHEMVFRLMLASSYMKQSSPEKAMSQLQGLDYGLLDRTQTNNLIAVLGSLRAESELDTDPLMAEAWEGIIAPKPNQKRADERRQTFLAAGSTYFSPARAKKEESKGQRHTSSMFSVLAGKCELGTAAAILETKEPAEISALLERVEKWDEFPFPALSHAILAGTQFPLPSRPMPVEELDRLAGRLSKDMEMLRGVVEKCVSEDFSASWQSLTWTCGLAMAAVQRCSWENEKRDMVLARSFVKVERVFLPGCYSPEMLREENIRSLPPMHRFGWYCARAFDALEAGDPAGYARLLREGLDSCKTMKAMVEFLLEHTPELHGEERPDPELLELADKVRNMLALFSPDDPAVAALKASPVYQRVARFVEGDKPPEVVRADGGASLESSYINAAQQLPS